MPCETVEIFGDEPLINFGSEIKAIERKGDFLTVGGRGILYGNAATKDLVGDWFTPETYFGARKGVGVDMMFHHGIPLSPELAEYAEEILPPVVKTHQDSAGLLYETVLDLRRNFERKIARMIEEGLLSTSTGAVSHAVRREAAKQYGEIKRWLFGEFSFTPIPCEPRLGCVAPLKSVDAQFYMPDQMQSAIKCLNDTAFSLNVPLEFEGKASRGHLVGGVGQSHQGGHYEGAQHLPGLDERHLQEHEGSYEPKSISDLHPAVQKIFHEATKDLSQPQKDLVAAHLLHRVNPFDNPAPGTKGVDALDAASAALHASSILKQAQQAESQNRAGTRGKSFDDLTDEVIQDVLDKAAIPDRAWGDYSDQVANRSEHEFKSQDEVIEATEKLFTSRMPFEWHSEAVRAAVEGFKARIDDYLSDRAQSHKAGRVLSSENHSRLKSHHEALRSICDDMGKLLEQHGPEDEKDKGLDAYQALARYELTRAQMNGVQI